MKYHAHIYFSETTVDSAQLLQLKMRQRFENERVAVYDLRLDAVGPHPLPMFEANFAESLFAEILGWLERERSGHTVLIHRDTGQDLKDHTEQTTWLGDPLPLDFNKFLS